MSIYPDGMRESDLPGHYDVPCPDCDEGVADESCSWCAGTGMVDERDLDDDGDYEPEPDFPGRYYRGDLV